jgi:autotransporter-associated beta strand protein
MLRSVVTAVSVCAWAADVQAQSTYTWRGASATWSTPANWWGGSFYPGQNAGDTALFVTNGSTQPTLDLNVTLDSLTVTGSVAWTWGGAAQTATVNNVFLYTDSAASTFNPSMAGNGSVVVARAGGMLTLGNGTNTYTGPTAIRAGTLAISGSVFSNKSYLGTPALGNEPILLGDPDGTNPATLKLTSSQFYRPIQVQTGGTGNAVLDLSGGGVTLWNPVALNKDLYVLSANGGTSSRNAYFTNSVSGPGALRLYQSGTAYSLTYPGLLYYTTGPGYTGGTTLSNNFYLRWTYPTNLPNDTVLTFGTDVGGVNPATFSINGGYFMWTVPGGSGTKTFTLSNPFVVNGPLDARLSGSGPNNASATNAFAGTLALGARLTLASLNNGTPNAWLGTASLLQSAPARLGLLVDNTPSGAMSVWAKGNITDGPGNAGNALALRAASIGSLATCFTLTGSGHSYAYGTLLEDGFGVISFTAPSGTLGLGPIWLQEGGLLRLGAASQVAPGMRVQVASCGLAAGYLSVAGNSLPPLTSDSSGVLGIDTTSFNAVSDLSALGNGRMTLGTIAGGTFSGTTLAPGSDGIYRLSGSAVGTLTVNKTNVLTGSAAVQVGAPFGLGGREWGAPNAGGWGWVNVTGPQNYTGGSVVGFSSLFEGTGQTNGWSPFGSASGGMTLNGGFVQLDGGSAPVTNDVGQLTVHGSGSVVANQAGTAITVIQASLGGRSSAAPWVLMLNGGSVGAGRSLGGTKERIVLSGGGPTVSNNMVAPYLITLRSPGANRPYQGIPDFLTYVSDADACGAIGFTNAINGYSNVYDDGSLRALPATAIANITNSVCLTAPATVHALRMETSFASTYLTNNGTAQTLTIGSGGMLFYTSQGSSGGAFYLSNNVVLGAEGVINLWCRSDDNVYTPYLYLQGTVAGTNGLTINAGRNGAVNLSGNNVGLTGTIAVVRGSLAYTADTALGAPSNPIYLDGGMLNWASGLVNNRPITLGPAGGAINHAYNFKFTNNATITGTGPLYLFIPTSATIPWNATNHTYSGGTYITGNSYGGGVVVASNSTLGVGDVFVSSSYAIAYLYGDRNIGGGDFYAGGTNTRQARLFVAGCLYAGGPGSAYFYSASPSIGSLSGGGNVYLDNTLLTLGGDNSSTIFNGQILPTAVGKVGRLRKTGSGTFSFKGLATITGTNIVDGGTFVVDGTMSSGFAVTNATLAGAGSAGVITLGSGAVLQPGSPVVNAVASNRMGTLAAAGLVLNSGATVTVNVYGPTNYTQLVANGPVSINGATLQVNMLYKPATTSAFYIVLNSSTSGTTGSFAGAPEGKLIALNNGYYGKISYVATGDATANNDIRITSITTGLPGLTLIFR